MKDLLLRIYKRLPLIRELRDINTALRTANAIAANHFIQAAVQNSEKYSNHAKLIHYERQVFSQNGEDGIVAEIFRRIKTKSKFFVECGVGDGLENNTTFLLTQGWKGCWIEGSARYAGIIQRHFRKPLGSQQLKLQHSFITAENVVDLFSKLNVPETFDFMSLDIDRNTYQVWKALSRYKPRVVAMEYNGSFLADAEWVADYDAARYWNGSMYFGASLKSYELLGRELGYVLVGCDFTGTNAFFVRETEQTDLFVGPFTSEEHYEPIRHDWMLRRLGPPACFDDTN
jgi:hypothetical protein